MKKWIENFVLGLFFCTLSSIVLESVWSVFFQFCSALLCFYNHKKCCQVNLFLIYGPTKEELVATYGIP